MNVLHVEMISAPHTEGRVETAPVSKKPSKMFPFNPGDHLSRVEFERRYQAHPEVRRAELIEGVVYMPSPVRHQKHGLPHGMLITWLGVYQSATSGVVLSVEPSLRLDYENEVQPDALLRLETRLGGRSRVTEDDYLEGAPELMIEIAASSAAYDLYEKRRIYQRNGVQEYLVLQMYEQHAIWFALRGGSYEALKPDANGALHSEIFPGLILQPSAVWDGNMAALLAALQEGLASPAHKDFVTYLGTIKG